MKWVVALAAALIGIAACASFGASDGASTTAVPEGGTASDAGLTAPPTDGAAPASDGAVARFCDGATGTLFCDDFDGPALFSSGVGVVTPDSEGVGGTPATVPGHEGNGISCLVPSNDAGSGPSDVSAERIVIPGTHDLRVEADVFFDPVAGYAAQSASIGILAVDFGDVGTVDTAVAIVAQSPFQESIYVTDGLGNIAEQYAQDQLVTTGQWIRLRLDVGLIDQGDGKPGFARVTWGSDLPVDAIYQNATDGGLTRSLLLASSNTTVWFGGIRYVGNSVGAPVTLRIDNVTVTLL